MHITLKQVEAFLAVASTLSFSRAAEQVHLSQPALSATVQKLEDAIGARLFDRDTRTVSLSVVGAEFVPIATALLQQAGSSLDQIRDIVAGKRGRLIIACAPSVAASALPQVLVRYKQLHPQVDVRVQDALAKVCLERVRTGEADVALVPMSTEADDLEQLLLYRDPLIVVCPQGHPLAARASVGWSDVIACPLVVRSSESSVRQLLDAQFLQHGSVLTPAFEVEHLGTFVGLIRAGLGIGVLPASNLLTLNTDGLVHKELDTHPRPHRAICATTARNRARPPTVAAFVQLCVQQLGAQGAASAAMSFAAPTA